MLRKIRIILAIVCFVAVNLLLLGAGWHLNLWLSWVAKIQFLPAVLAMDFAVLAGLIILTLIFGRLYCSVICPLGVMQDLFGWLGKKQRKNRYGYSPEKSWLRYTVLAVFIVGLIIGFAPVTTLLAPYSAYGRIVNSLFRPLYDLLGNGLAALDARYEWYLFSDAEIWLRSVTTFVVALLTLLVLAVLSWRNGHTYCNTVCPVGTVLSLFARFSLLRVELDKSKCKNCSLCEKNCKAAAIDFRAGTVDYSRCVVCGDCLDKCKHDALHYSLRQLKANATQGPAADHPASPERRAMLTGVAVAIGTAAMAQAKIKVDGGLAEIEDKQVPNRQTPVTPPGSISARNMQRHCTACQLCVSACKNNVLRPSTDPLHLMQPVMSFERGYCRPECTDCSQVCPTGAIRPVTVEDKTAIHVGHAVWIAENCVPVAKGDQCGACARHCPADAIQMVDYTTADGRTVQVPAIDNERCIGCGKCEYLCPARPLSAIYVEGNVTHHIS
ncbi:MAG: 4Fe-4S binding protein [Paludibacteraceae bacterium]|nr:4Fe-4S binding protein [Paludibacteraceae bacterium]